MSTPETRPTRGRRYAPLMAVLFAAIAVANLVRAAVDPGAGASWVVGGLFGLGAVCFLAAHLTARRAGSRGPRR
jgi:hypothetical protein